MCVCVVGNTPGQGHRPPSPLGATCFAADGKGCRAWLGRGPHFLTKTGIQTHIQLLAHHATPRPLEDGAATPLWIGRNGGEPLGTSVALMVGDTVRMQTSPSSLGRERL